MSILEITPNNPAAIVVEDLHKSFSVRGRTVTAVDGLSFSVGQGEIFGLLGPNGAGKTTTMRMLTTLLPIDAGRALVAGVDVAAHPGQVRLRIGYVSQAGGADTLATGKENLSLQGALYGMSRDELAIRIPEGLRLLDLDEIANRKVSTYSGGQRRRLDVALGIVHGPEVLFLDEPSTGLDPQNRANLWEHIRSLAEAGTTVVLTTHYLEEADALCQRVVIVDHGNIIAEGTPAGLKAEVAPAAIEIGLHDPTDTERAAQAIGTLGGISDLVSTEGGLRLHVGEGPTLLPVILRALEDEQISVGSLSMSESSLDDVFLAATGRSLRDSAGLPNLKGTK